MVCYSYVLWSGEMQMPSGVFQLIRSMPRNKLHPKLIWQQTPPLLLDILELKFPCEHK